LLNTLIEVWDLGTKYENYREQIFSKERGYFWECKQNIEVNFNFIGISV